MDPDRLARLRAGIAEVKEARVLAALAADLAHVAEEAARDVQVTLPAPPTPAQFAADDDPLDPNAVPPQEVPMYLTQLLPELKPLEPPMNKIGTLLKSKTVWGAILAAGAWVLNQPHVDPQTVITAVGTVLSAIGVRDAIGKSAGSSQQ